MRSPDKCNLCENMYQSPYQSAAEISNLVVSIVLFLLFVLFFRCWLEVVTKSSLCLGYSGQSRIISFYDQ